jgi:hypothetical protein
MTNLDRMRKDIDRLTNEAKRYPGFPHSFKPRISLRSCGLLATRTIRSASLTRSRPRTRRPPIGLGIFSNGATSKRFLPHDRAPRDRNQCRSGSPGLRYSPFAMLNKILFGNIIDILAPRNSRTKLRSTLRMPPSGASARCGPPRSSCSTRTGNPCSR